MNQPESENFYLSCQCRLASESLKNFLDTNLCRYKDYSNKFYPAYFNELAHYPETNPIFIAADLLSLRFIRRLEGICLFCEKALHQYDFGFCYQREIWVLHSHSKYFSLAMRIAQTAQSHGAEKILILRLGINHEKEKHYAAY
jgi:hypothetical protein